MNKLIKAILASSVASYALIYSTNLALAQSGVGKWGDKCSPSNVPTDIKKAIMNVTNWILGFVAIIATLVIIYGGVMYLTAGGNEDNVASAKKTISFGIIGIVICGLAYAIVIVVSTVILTA
ncbi:MAG: hypothetical protein U9N04_03755 [Patescibacteria group bacterium]|nr:hypothetical protein [Patescibacteria group bacterium]